MYKRQEWYCDAQPEAYAALGEETQDIIEKMLKKVSSVSEEAVSYTHLDVYKRQAQAGRHTAAGRAGYAGGHGPDLPGDRQPFPPHAVVNQRRS